MVFLYMLYRKQPLFFIYFYVSVTRSAYLIYFIAFLFFCRVNNCKITTSTITSLIHMEKRGWIDDSIIICYKKIHRPFMNIRFNNQKLDIILNRQKTMGTFLYFVKKTKLETQTFSNTVGGICLLLVIKSINHLIRMN